MKNPGGHLVTKGLDISNIFSVFSSNSMRLGFLKSYWRMRQALGYNAGMARTQESKFPFPPKRVYRGPNIPMRVIHRYARAIALEFHPEQIILFGSYASGKPNEDSDVDLLVVMPARNQHDQAVRIRWRLAAPFPLDLIVRTPKQITWRMKEGESFTTAVVSKGKVL